MEARGGEVRYDSPHPASRLPSSKQVVSRVCVPSFGVYLLSVCTFSYVYLSVCTFLFTSLVCSFICTFFVFSLVCSFLHLYLFCVFLLLRILMHVRSDVNPATVFAVNEMLSHLFVNPATVFAAAPCCIVAHYCASYSTGTHV